MSFDTLHLEHQIKKLPKDFAEKEKKIIRWKNLDWHPTINKYGYLSYYYTYINNLKLVLKEDKIYIKNSLQCFYMYYNYQSFTYSQIVEAFNKLDNLLPFNIYEFIVTRLAIGVVIIENAEKIYSEWQYYLGKPPIPMFEKTKVYGSKFHLTDYYIKGYDKTFQVKCKDSANIGKPYFRFELEGKTKFFNNKTNNVGIQTVADLINKEKYQKLCSVLLGKYQKIEKEPKMDLSQLNIKEKRLVASMKDNTIMQSIKKQHPDSYKSDREKYLNLKKQHQNTDFQNKVYYKLKQQILYSINN